MKRYHTFSSNSSVEFLLNKNQFQVCRGINASEKVATSENATFVITKAARDLLSHVPSMLCAKWHGLPACFVHEHSENGRSRSKYDRNNKRKAIRWNSEHWHDCRAIITAREVKKEKELCSAMTGHRRIHGTKPLTFSLRHLFTTAF